MARSKKQQRQIIMLSVVSVIIVGVLVYFYRDKLLPKPQGQAAVLTPPPRMVIPQPNAEELYKREDYKNLKHFGETPVRPIAGQGSREPFITELEQLR